LGEIFHLAADSVYRAMDDPVEGTMLSVMRAIGTRAREVSAQTGCDLHTLLAAMSRAAEEALRRTPEQLPVLRAAAVVDAGAQGLVNFLLGAGRGLRGEVATPPAVTSSSSATVSLAHHRDDQHRFCTEVTLRGVRVDRDRLRGRFAGLGSSLQLAVGEGVCKLHIHTDRPDEIFRLAARLGAVDERKVDDMWRQGEVGVAAVQSPLVPFAEQPASVAVVCDSTADLPAALRIAHGIELVPLQVLFGNEVFRDQVDLSSAEFYRRLVGGDAYPTTSQPAPRAFLEALDRVRPDREVVVATLSQRLSGTLRAARHGVMLAKQPRVEVVDSGSVSLGLGMMTLNAARLAALGASMNDVLEWFRRWQRDTGLIFSLATLEYLHRGGRIGRARWLAGRLLGVRPLLTFDGGEVVPLAKVRSGEEAAERATAILRQRLPEGTTIRLGLVEIGQSELLDLVYERLSSWCEVVETIRAVPTGVIGCHAGPGAWGAFYQVVRDDDPLLGAVRGPLGSAEGR
jgi:DegV family protein with EDD domain